MTPKSALEVDLSVLVAVAAGGAGGAGAGAAGAAGGAGGGAGAAGAGGGAGAGPIGPPRVRIWASCASNSSRDSRLFVATQITKKRKFLQ